MSYPCPVDGSPLKAPNDLAVGRQEDGRVLVIFECETCRRAARPPFFQMRRTHNGEIVSVSYPV